MACSSTTNLGRGHLWEIPSMERLKVRTYSGWEKSLHQFVDGQNPITTQFFAVFRRNPNSYQLVQDFVHPQNVVAWSFKGSSSVWLRTNAKFWKDQTVAWRFQVFVILHPKPWDWWLNLAVFLPKVFEHGLVKCGEDQCLGIEMRHPLNGVLLVRKVLNLILWFFPVTSMARRKRSMCHTVSLNHLLSFFFSQPVRSTQNLSTWMVEYPIRLPESGYIPPFLHCIPVFEDNNRISNDYTQKVSIHAP